MRTTRFLTAAIILLSTIFSSYVRAGSLMSASEWRPTEIGGVDVPAKPEMFVRFGGEGQLEGHGGCNRFFGTYKLDGDTIEIGPLGGTRMRCSEPMMDLELRFFAALGNTATYMRDRINLLLYETAGNVSMRLVQTDAD